MPFEKESLGNAAVVRAAQRSPVLETWRRRIVAVMSSSMTRLLTGLPFAVACMYPALLWPLIEHSLLRPSVPTWTTSLVSLLPTLWSRVLHEREMRRIRAAWRAHRP